MTQPRCRLVSLDDTPYYHCISRCVRRAFLCGADALTGKDFSHRRAWVETRLLELTNIFAIEVAAYAVMSNHYHVVLRVDRDRCRAWSSNEVLDRWTSLFCGPPLIQRYRSGERMSTAEIQAVESQIEVYRERLHDLSWYMRCVNEPLARMANLEDGCTGRFWEGRFKSQALLDERALLSCMAYVDLNPIRAGIAETPESSSFTSVQRRIKDPGSGNSSQRGHLIEFEDKADAALPFALKSYLDLVDWAGRAVRPDKHGAIPPDLPSMLNRLQIEPDPLIHYLRRSESPFSSVIGPIEKIRVMAQRLNKGFFKGSLEAAGLVIQTG